MLSEKIEQFIKKEIRSRVDEKLSKPTPACRECTRRITALEKQTRTTMAAVCSSHEQEPEPETKRRFYRITGTMLLKLREKWGLTQSDVALLLDTTHNSVNRWERDKRKPSTAMKKRIAELRDQGKRKALKRLKEQKQKIADTIEPDEVETPED